VSNKAVLLRSVSTIATAAASTVLGAHGAQAQVVPAGTDGYYYSVTGGFALSKSEEFLTGLNDKFGYSGSGTSSYVGSDYSSFSSYDTWGSSYSSGLDAYKGLFASVQFGKQIDPNWDVRGGLSMTGTHASGYAWTYGGASSYYEFSGLGTNSGYTGSGWSYSSGGAYAYGDFKTSLLAADFEVGYTPTLGNNFNVRLFAGLRALQFQTTFTGISSGSGYYSSYYSSSYPGTGYYSSWYSSFSSSYFDGVVKSTFTGIGPRVGIQASTRFEGTNFGLSGSLATAVLFGKQTVKTSGYYQYSGYYSGAWNSAGSGSSYSGSSSGSGYSSYSSTFNKTVLDVQASVGVDYYLNDNTVLTVGYQGEKLVDVGNSSGTPIDNFTHGGFIKLSGSF